MPKKKDWTWEEIKKEAEKEGVNLEGEESGLFAKALAKAKEMAKGIATAGAIGTKPKGKSPALKPSIVGGPRKGIPQEKKRLRKVEKYMSEGLTDKQANHAADLSEEEAAKYVAECKRKNKQKPRR